MLMMLARFWRHARGGVADAHDAGFFQEACQAGITADAHDAGRLLKGCWGALYDRFLEGLPGTFYLMLMMLSGG